MFSDKSGRAKQNKHLIAFPENHAVYELMWKKWGTARQATHEYNDA
jgi:hypothetical protein